MQAERAGESTARSLEQILLEKGFEADQRIAALRLLVTAASTVLYAAMDRAGTTPWLAWPLIVAAWPYGLWMYLAQPFRRWPSVTSAGFLISDAVFVVIWLAATGGIDSPFAPMLFLATFAVGFRYATPAVIAGTLAYAAAYVILLVARGELAPHATEAASRVVFVGFAAALGALAARQVRDQALATQDALARLQDSRGRAIEAEKRSRFLAEASRQLASSLDYAKTLDTVARLVVPDLGDTCVVDVLDEKGVVRRVAEAAMDEEVEHTLRMFRELPTGEAEGSPVRQAMRSSASVIVPEIGEAQIAELAKGRGEEYIRLVRRIGSRWSVTVPLVVHERPLGALTFGRAVGAYDEGDTRLAEELALRAAIAIEHARLFRDAQDAVKTRDEFLSIASHELRTPLNVMQLQTDGLLRAAKKANETHLFAPLERNRRQVHRLATLVESLLDVSRVTAGRLALDVSDVDLAAVAGEVVARMKDEATRAGSSIQVEARAHPSGRWDRLRLDQIVTNLLSNAIKYGRGQPITIAIDARDGRAMLSVSDRGIGIGEEDQARIFDRFERAVSVRHYGGFGLGLWIVRQIVEAHGGVIAIHSRVGEGSTFRVELPTAGPPPQPAVEAPPPPP